MPRDAHDRSTRVNVYSEGVGGANHNMLLFDEASPVGKITIADGRVVEVQVEDV